MLTAENLGKYLRVGFIDDLDYGDVHPINDIPFDDAKSRIIEILEEYISELDPDKSAFVTTGGLNSASILAFKNGPDVKTFGFTGTWSLDLSEYFNTTHFLADFSNIEEDLIEVNKLFDTPHLGTIGDVFIYSRLKKIHEQGIKIDVCEGGPEWLMLSYIFVYPELFGLTAKRLEYNLNLAKELKDKSGYSKSSNFSLGRAVLIDSKIPYIESLIDNYAIFPIADIEYLGYPSPTYELRKDNIFNLIQASVDWLAKNRLTSKVIAKSFGIEIDSPYFMNKSMVDFCLSLPIEYRYCYGSKKHILREAMGHLLPGFMWLRMEFDPDRNNFSRIRSQIALLNEKYLRDKSMKIYNYLDYDKVQQIDEFRKKWSLLNLSVWLETNENV